MGPLGWFTGPLVPRRFSEKVQKGSPHPTLPHEYVGEGIKIGRRRAGRIEIARRHEYVGEGSKMRRCRAGQISIARPHEYVGEGVKTAICDCPEPNM